MIYGISLIYLGPYISRYVDASNDKRGYVFTGCLLGSMTFLSFYFFEGLWAAVVGVLLLGLSSSFVLASQSAYVLQLPVTQALGEGKAIGIFRSSSRIGQALGPMVFSAVMAGGDTGKGIIFFGLMYLLTAFLFLLMNQKRSRASVLQEAGGF
jgi:predicted MFS family arabinose efflux permease